MLILVSLAKAHEWYPMDCCSGLDCAPVENTSKTTPSSPNELPQMVVTTKHGTVIIPNDFPIRESKDNRFHVCMRPGVQGFGMRLICVFAPPGT